MRHLIQSAHDFTTVPYNFLPVVHITLVSAAGMDLPRLKQA